MDRIPVVHELLHPVDSFQGVLNTLPTVPAPDVADTQDLMDGIDAVMRFAGSFEPGLYSGADAKKLVIMLSEHRRVTTSLIMRAAKRVEETHTHELDGHKRAGSWLATITGESVGSAASSLEAARSIEAHPEIAEAFRSGSLSEAKAKEIASAADVCPDQARDLVEAAANLELAALKRHCADTRSVRSSEKDETERYEQIRSKRYCRTWSDPDGSGRLDARVTPDALAVLLACLEPFEERAFSDARLAGREESHQAYMADALVSMAKASVSGSGSTTSSDSTGGPKTLVRTRVDLSALKRGHRNAGETCEIPGIGSVPVKAVREILGDSILELVLTNGTDVTTVCTDSRYIRKALRIALEERDQTCCVPDCNMSDPLEVDHWNTDFAKGGETSLHNLARLCPYHHHQKTYRGWRLEGGPGNWRFVGPDPPERSEATDRSEHEEKRDPSKEPAAPRTREPRTATAIAGPAPPKNGPARAMLEAERTGGPEPSGRPDHPGRARFSEPPLPGRDRMPTGIPSTSGAYVPGQRLVGSPWAHWGRC